MRLLLVLFLFSLSVSAFGQKNYTLSFRNNDYKKIVKHPQTKFKDSTKAVQYLNTLQNTAIQKGYLLASIDSLDYSKNKAIANFYLGNKFGSAQLSVAKEELLFIRKRSRISEKLLLNSPITPREFQATLEKIQDVYLNNGFPFSKISLENQSIENDVLNANIDIERGPLVQWTKIHIKGDSSVSLKYITNLIGVQINDIYDLKQLRTISNKILQVPFIEEIKPHEILFTPDGCELFLYLKSVPISSFNGIVGLQPDPLSDKLSITGELNLKLLNVLKRGELLDIKWQSIRDQTQSLTSHLNYPFLFNTPFGIDGSFDLYKRDTSFLELNSTIGVQYFLNQGNYLKLYYQNISSSILEGGQNNPLFSKLGNVNTNSYGISYVSNRVDYLPNPTKGFNLKIGSSVGSRKSQLNDSSSVIRSSTFRGIINAEWFIPLHKRHVLRFGNVTEFYSADEIFENEVYRFGGLGAQRGFNEDELFASTRTTGVIEYRFLLDKNSHVFAFADQTWYENNTAQYYSDAPLGFGVGFSFRTNFGVFSISYALGKQQNNPILLSNSKIHFGYIAYF
jgi:outer membrane protein assembly factor BamA